MSTTIQHFEDGGFSAIRLANRHLETVLIPELGGKITNLRSLPDGRQWLWSNPHLSRRRAQYADSYIALHDTGGIDECLPTVDPCVLLEAAGSWEGLALPDHGELTRQAWQIIDEDVNGEGAAVVTLEAHGIAMPYRLRRSVSVGAEASEILFEYELENLAPEPLPWIWCQHAAVDAVAGMRIELPAAVPVRCAAAIGEAPARPGDMFQWPVTQAGYDLGRVPEECDGRAFALKLFAGPLQSGWARLAVGCDRLTARFDPLQIPHLALWLNYGAWSGAGAPALFNLVLEPAIGARDSLAEALADGAGTPWLARGEKRCWWVSLAPGVI